MDALKKAGAFEGPCYAGSHKITVQYGDNIAGKDGPQRDFHFSREFDDGTWWHKQGDTCPVKLKGPDDIPPGYVKCGEICVPDGWDTDSLVKTPTPRL